MSTRRSKRQTAKTPAVPKNNATETSFNTASTNMNAKPEQMVKEQSDIRNSQEFLSAEY